MRRVLFDTTVFVYAQGRAHPYMSACRRIVEDIRSGAIEGEASVDLVQEFAHVALRQMPRRDEALALVREVSEMCALHDFNVTDLPLVMTLLDTHPQLGARDAVFAATALNRGIEAILSADRDFDGIPGLERIDPADEAAVATLRR
jgi:predicted nucleic acid-binding protein